MDFELFGVLFAIFTALSWYGSVPGTAINPRATIPERVFGSLQLTSVLHTASVVRAHFEHPTEPGQPTLGTTTSLPSSLLPDLEDVLERLKEVEMNKSAVVFYYQPGTVIENTRMPGDYQVPPVTPGNSVQDAILEVIADSTWTICWFLFFIIAFIRLSRTSKQDADRSCSRAGHASCSNTVGSEGLVEKLNVIDKTTTRTNDRFNDLHVDFASLLQRTGELNRPIEESQNSPQAGSTAVTSRFASIDNELESIRRSLASRSEGRDYQFEISELQKGKMDSGEATEQFSSLSEDIRTLKRVVNLKPDESDFEDVARVSRKNASNYTDLSDRLEGELKVLKQTIDSKTTPVEYESLIAELKRFKSERSASDNQATKNSTPSSQPASDQVLAEIEKLKQEVRGQRAELDSYRSTPKRPEDSANAQSVEPKKDAENPVSGEIQERLNTIQESLASKIDIKGLEPFNLKVSNLTKDILDVREQQKAVRGAQDTQDSGSRISKLTTEVEELKSSAILPGDNGDPVPVPPYIPSEATIKGMEQNIKKVQQEIQGYNTQITELKNFQTSDNALTSEFKDLKRDVNKFRDRVGEVEKLKGDLPELKKKLEEMNQSKPSFEEPSQLQLGAFKEEVATTFAKLRNEIGENKSPTVPSGVQSQLDTFKKDLGKAEERYNKGTDVFEHEFTYLKTRIDTAEHSLSKNFEPELGRLKKAMETIKEKVNKINPQGWVELKEKIGAMEQVKAPKGAPHSDISKIVENKIRENKDLRDVYALRSRVEVIEKGLGQPAKNAPKKKGEVDTTIPLLIKLKEIEKHLGFNKDNVEEATKKGFENSKELNDMKVYSDGTRNLASTAWSWGSACKKAIRALTGDIPGESDYQGEEKGQPVPRLLVIEKQVRINKENIEDAIGKISGGKVALQTDEKPSPPGPTGAGPGGNSGSKGGNPDKNAPASGPTDGGSGGDDVLVGGGPAENPPPNEPLDEDSEASDESDEDSEGDSRPLVSAPTLGKYAVVNPATIAASSSKTDIPSRSTPSTKSDALANASVFDPKHPNNQDKGNEKNPFSKSSAPDSRSSDNDKGMEKDQHAEANMSVFNSKHPDKQGSKKGSENNPFAKLTTPDPPHKEGQSSDNKESETPSNGDAKTSTSGDNTITPAEDSTTLTSDSTSKPGPGLGGDDKKLETQADSSKKPADSKEDVKKDEKKGPFKSMSRWDPNYEGEDKLASPPKDKGKTPIKSMSRWDPDYEGEDKLASPTRKDGEKDTEKRTRHNPNYEEDDKQDSPPRKRNKSLNDAESGQDPPSNTQNPTPDASHSNSSISHGVGKSRGSQGSRFGKNKNKK